MSPSTLSPSVTEPSSTAWPEVMATSVDPFPLSDTPPPLPAKKHRRQQPQEQQVTRKGDRAQGSQGHLRSVFIFSKADLKKKKEEGQVAKHFSCLLYS